MKFNATFSSIFLLSLFLVVSTIDGRKDLGNYWGTMMKDEPMPDAIKNLINVSPSEDVQANDYIAVVEEKPFAKIFDPIPNVSVYHDDVHPNEIKYKSFAKVFDPIPNVSVYRDNDIKSKSFAKVFDPIPNVSVYHDDVHPNEIKSIEKDCESHQDGPKEKKPYMNAF